MNTSNISINPSPLFQIGEPLLHHLPQLRSLWKEAFGDDDAYLDSFYTTAFSSHRCRCITIDETVVAVLYWFDCIFQEKPIAYIYGVATAKAYQGQGLCHALMEHTHKYLADRGYIGIVLVPAHETLFVFYEKIGYQTCCYIDEISYDIQDEILQITFLKPQTLNRKQENTVSDCIPISNLNFKELNLSFSNFYNKKNMKFPLYELTKEEFAHFRRKFLSKESILQEKENLDFLETQAQFYLGENFLLTASKNENFLYGLELLGDASAIPQIVEAFDCTKGRFRVPKKKKAFAMYLPLNENTEMPDYFGFAFD